MCKTWSLPAEANKCNCGSNIVATTSGAISQVVVLWREKLSFSFMFESGELVPDAQIRVFKARNLAGCFRPSLRMEALTSFWPQHKIKGFRLVPLELYPWVLAGLHGLISGLYYGHIGQGF